MSPDFQGVHEGRTTPPYPTRAGVVRQSTPSRHGPPGSYILARRVRRMNFMKPSDKTKGGLMRDERLPLTGFKSDAGDAAARHDARQVEPGKTGRQETRRTVGVYERPARRAGLSLPLLLILILASLISLVLSVRFLF